MNRFIASTFFGVATALLLSAAAQAQTQTAFAERSQIFGEGQDVHLYGLSTKDSAGKVRCYDVTISLAVGPGGKPADSAPVNSVACPKVKVNEFVPGHYTDTSGAWSCELVASPFAGRTESDLFCANTNDGRHYTYTWYTGPIAGSPIEAQLKAAKLDTLPNNDQYAWGRITRTDFSQGCTTFGWLFGARQIGDNLQLSIYGTDTVLDCTAEFVKTTP